jgi:PPIC-type PPIASE domain
MIDPRSRGRRVLRLLPSVGFAIAVAGCYRGRVVARSGDAVLTDRRLATLFAESGARDPGAFFHDMLETWAAYQGLGRAAAAGDTLRDSVTMADALEPALVSARLEAWLKRQADVWIAAESGGFAWHYDHGQPLAARDVVFGGRGPDSAQLGWVQAARFRTQVTPTTFEAVARRLGGRYEDLGVFAPGRLAPDLERAVRGTPPGEISAVVTTPYGTHVLYRPTYGEVAAAVGKRERPGVISRAQRAYEAAVDSAGKARLVGNAIDTVRAVARAPERHASDSTVVATSAVGDLTAARVVWWLGVFPEAAGRVVRAPDSLVRQFVVNIVGYEVMLRSADSAGVTVDSSTLATLRGRYRLAVVAAWRGLGVDPAALGTLRSVVFGGRERWAARRVDAYVDRLFLPASRARFVAVTPAAERAVALRYPASVNREAVDSLTARVALERVHADSLRESRLPRSAIPMPAH